VGHSDSETSHTDRRGGGVGVCCLQAITPQSPPTPPALSPQPSLPLAVLLFLFLAVPLGPALPQRLHHLAIPPFYCRSQVGKTSRIA
jgi:hypothetical protein